MSEMQRNFPSLDFPEALRSPALSALAGIRHAFFTRQGGCSEGLYHSLNGGVGSADAQANVLENRKRMAAHFGLGHEGLGHENLVTLHQIHSADVVVVEQPFPLHQRPRADAMVTNRRDIILGIATADCGPLLFADPEAGVIGAAHSGWKGALGGVLEETVAKMEEIGAERQNITVALGPTISRQAYEVGPEFQEHFLAVNDAYAHLFSPSDREGYAYFDLPAFIKRQAEKADIKHFEDINLCTYSDEKRFYSYRRSTHKGEADYGRLISAIML